MISPIEQFDIIAKDVLGFLGHFQTTMALNMLGSIGFTLWLTYIYMVRSNLIATSGQLVMEEIYRFVGRLIKEQLGLKQQWIMPILISLVLIIGMANLIGLVPFGLAITSYLGVTLIMSITVWVSTVIFGFWKNGMNFLRIFLPSIGWEMVVILIIIELVSYTIRAFSLAIRLSANITAGHTLLHVIAGLNLGLLKVCISIFPITFILIMMILSLEFGIAIVQTYVFVMLVSIYINDVINISKH